MRPPARIEPWLSTEALQVWVREAPDKGAYQRRLAIWLTDVCRLPAHRVAESLCVSKQAVWLWIAQYNQQGPEGSTSRGAGRASLGLALLGGGRALLGEAAAGCRPGPDSHRPATARRTGEAHSRAACRWPTSIVCCTGMGGASWDRVPDTPKPSLRCRSDSKKTPPNPRKK